MAATVRVRNLGPFDRDICPDRRDVLATVPVGGVIEVGAALGASLAEQVDAWEIVTDAPSKGEKAGAEK